MESNYIKPYSVKLVFAWYDIWIGVFIDKNKKLIYFFPIPMIGLRFKYGYLEYKSAIERAKTLTDEK